MAATRTLLLMRTSAKQLADMENSSFVADSEWTRWINLGCKKIYDQLVRARGFEYYAQKATVNTVAGTETVALPSDFYKVWGVSAAIQGENISLGKLTLADRDRYDTASGWRIGAVPRYKPMKSSLLLRPVPDGVYTITFWYTPHFTDLVADGDTFDGINGWEDYAEVFAAIRAGLKEESDVSMLKQELAEIEARIETFGDERDEGQPASVQDVRPMIDPEYPWG